MERVLQKALVRNGVARKVPKKCSELRVSYTTSTQARSPEHFFLRKSVVSIKFLPVILGSEMAAPILWVPGIFWFFLLEIPHAHKIPPFRGGGGSGFLFEGVEVPILFYGREDFSDFRFLGTPFRTSTFRRNFSALLLVGASALLLDACQDCKSRESLFTEKARAPSLRQQAACRGYL